MTAYTHTAVAASIVSAYSSAAKAEVKIVAAIAAATHGRDSKAAKSEAKAITATPCKLMPPIKLGRLSMWEQGEVEEWMLEQGRISRSEVTQ